MPIEIRKAERHRVKLRIGLFGPSGAGKSMSALKIAHGLAPWEKICVVDTENGSADLYSHLGPYSVVTLTPPYEPEKYVEAIKAIVAGGFEVVIVDSITHEWQGTGGMLEIADSLLPSIRDGRLIWTKITPRHNRFIDALLQSPAHTISCGRSKTDTVLVESERNGRKVSIPEQVGLKAITREGFDYEMTVSFDIAKNHYATCTKDRTKGDDGLALFQDKSPRLLDEQVGIMLKKWSEEGKVDLNAVKRDIRAELNRLDIALPIDKNDAAAFMRDAAMKLTGTELKDENLDEILKGLKTYNDPALAKKIMFGRIEPGFNPDGTLAEISYVGGAAGGPGPAESPIIAPQPIAGGAGSVSPSAPQTPTTVAESPKPMEVQAAADPVVVPIPTATEPTPPPFLQTAPDTAVKVQEMFGGEIIKEPVQA